MLPAVIPQSIGMGLFFVPITLIATTNVGEEDAGLASGLFNTAQQVGGALGLGVLSTLAADKSTGVLGDLGRAPSRLEQSTALLEGFQVAFTAAAILVLVGAVLLALLVRKEDVEGVDPEVVPAPVACRRLQGIVHREGVRAGTTTPPNRRAPEPAERGNRCGLRVPRGRIAALTAA